MIEFIPGLSLAGVSNFLLLKEGGIYVHFIPEYLEFQKATGISRTFSHTEALYNWLEDIVHSGCKITTYSEQRNAAVN